MEPILEEKSQSLVSFGLQTTAIIKYNSNVDNVDVDANRCVVVASIK